MSSVAICAALRSWSSIVPASPGCMKAWPPMATRTIGWGSIMGPGLLRPEHLEDPVLRASLGLRLLLPPPGLPLEGRGRVRVAVENAGVELPAVLGGEGHRLEAVGRVVAEAREGLHRRLVGLQLLVLLTVGHAGRLHVHEGEAREADRLLDHRGEALH